MIEQQNFTSPFFLFVLIEPDEISVSSSSASSPSSDNHLPDLRPIGDDSVIDLTSETTNPSNTTLIDLTTPRAVNHAQPIIVS